MAAYIIERISSPSRNLDGSQNTTRILHDVVYTEGKHPLTTDKFNSGRVDLEDLDLYGGSVESYLKYFHFNYSEEQLNKLFTILLKEWEDLNEKS